MADKIDFHNIDETTLDSLFEGIQLIGFDWRYLFVNKAVVGQSKYASKDDLLGYTMMEKYPGIEKTEMFGFLEKCMNERVSVDLENEFIYPDHSRSWFELRICPVPKGIFILSIDITERKKTEQAREAHLNGLEEMMFMVSHKVRQPITNIIGISKLLKQSMLSQEELKKVIDYMGQSIHSLELFTKELASYINALERSHRRDL